MAEPKTVLVVDDVPDIRETLQMLLEIEGYHVLLAGNGKEALEQLHAGARPGLILLDLSMPVMGGEEFLARREAEGVAADVPVVIFAASRQRSEIETAAAWVMKPIDMDRLMSTVQRWYRDSAVPPT